MQFLQRRALPLRQKIGVVVATPWYHCLMKTIAIQCSPLSVNKAWQGRRFKTDDYKSYEIEVSALLPYDIKNTAEDGQLYELTYRFYLKYHATTDYDNLLKPLQDILVMNGVLKDDRFIYKAHQEKIPSDVDRIEILIEPYILPE